MKLNIYVSKINKCTEEFLLLIRHENSTFNYAFWKLKGTKCSADSFEHVTAKHEARRGEK